MGIRYFILLSGISHACGPGSVMLSILGEWERSHSEQIVGLGYM